MLLISCSQSLIGAFLLVAATIIITSQAGVIPPASSLTSSASVPLQVVSSSTPPHRLASSYSKEDRRHFIEPATTSSPSSPSSSSSAKRPRPSGSSPIAILSPAPNQTIPRLVIYFQTTHEKQDMVKPISMLPLITEKNIALTHLIVCTFHIYRNGFIALNDYPPWDPVFSTLWNETQVMKTAGVKVMGMVGGAATGSFGRYTLDAPPDQEDPLHLFETAYASLRDALRSYRLEGLDIDVEENMSMFGIKRLITRLRADFGPDFVITLSPVASSLTDDFGWSYSGFSYFELDKALGQEIEFYNAQFYNGHGSMHGTRGYERVLEKRWDPLRVVIGQLTTGRNGGGWVPFDRLKRNIEVIRGMVAPGGCDIGGIMGWEYFNGSPGNEEKPWQWAQEMTAILRPGLARGLTVTREMAGNLVEAWRTSVLAARKSVIWGGAGGGVGGGEELTEDDLVPDVNYWGMVNA